MHLRFKMLGFLTIVYLAFLTFNVLIIIVNTTAVAPRLNLRHGPGPFKESSFYFMNRVSKCIKEPCIFIKIKIAGLVQVSFSYIDLNINLFNLPK